MHGDGVARVTAKATFDGSGFQGTSADISEHFLLQHYVSGTDEYTKYLVEGESKHHDIHWTNICMDRYFTILKLNQVGIPAQIKDVKSLKEIPLYLRSLDENYGFVYK